MCQIILLPGNLAKSVLDAKRKERKEEEDESDEVVLEEVELTVDIGILPFHTKELFPGSGENSLSSLGCVCKRGRM